MDGNRHYPLVPVTPMAGTLVPVPVPEVVVAEVCDAADSADAEVAWLWACLRGLLGLWLLALLTLRQLQRQLAELRQQVGYWRAQHARAVDREAKLAAEIDRLQGELRTWKRRVFGRRSETTTATQPTNPHAPPTPKRPRGQQRGSPGPGRRSHEHLPTTHETCTLAADQRCCPNCQQPFAEIPGTSDGDILEIEVRGHRRRYHRQRYRRCCQCPGTPLLLTAPVPDKLSPKSNLGVSVWAFILEHKFAFYQPLHRVLAELRGAGMDLAAGTITGGLQKLLPLFEPLYKLLVDHNRGETHWHCDETRWLVFVPREGNANVTWYLWVFSGRESIVFVLDPTRAHDVPETHWGDDAQGIANVDRYSAYKATAQVKAGKIILAFCWAHVRRDFLAVLTGWAELTDWAWSWVEAIGALYDANDQRLAVRDDPPAFARADQQLRTQVEQLRLRYVAELAQPELRLPQRQVLTSLQAHWAGLTVFVEHPEVPLDNNTAERRHRGPVVARKNFYGSGALWSGRLAAILFALFQTVQLWGLDIGLWLRAYLTACAQAQGQPPPDPQRFLPWNLTEQQRQPFRPATTHPPDPKPRAGADTASPILT